MSLDLGSSAAQIQSLATRIQERARDKNNRLHTATDTLAKTQSEAVEAKHTRAKGKVTWLVAGLPKDLQNRQPAPNHPTDYIALGADGSSIDVDRHSPAHCYLINTGTALLQYGTQPEASLRSTPILYAEDVDLNIKDPASTRAEPIEGNILAAKRAVEEMKALLVTAKESTPSLPAIALLDGSLILWGIVGAQDFVQNALIEMGVIQVLEGFRALATKRSLAIASYLSFPRSTDVVNALRLTICPFEPADCDLNCGEKAIFHRECDTINGVLDRELFANILSPGERSPTFSSRSSIVQKKYGKHLVHFFYVNIGDEIARVEMPEWVAQNENLVTLLHGALLDQCTKGRGYPEVLAEAHGQAVIHEPDRQLFWRMVEDELTSQGISTTTSEKNRSKLVPWA